MNKTNTRRLVECAIFATVCFVITRLLAIPAFYTKGYVNLGDVAVLMTSYMIGGGYGAVAAGLGSAMADFSMSFYHYVPATFVIKALMVLISVFFFKHSERSESRFISVLLIAAGVILAETFMVLGYFAFELFLYKKGAFASLAGNCMQAIVCAVISVVIIIILKRSNFVKMIKK